MEFIEISSRGPNRNEEADLMRNRIPSLTYLELTHSRQSERMEGIKDEVR